MDGYQTDKKYESFKIPDRQQVQGDRAAQSLPQTKTAASVSPDEGLFYEIDYNAYSIPGAGKYVLKSQKIEPPEKDEIRELFHQMRDIARVHRSSMNYSRLFDRRVQYDNAIIFYKQGLFMKDFSDCYSDSTPFSQYFPYYQMMDYEQLRTYFTWRTEVRKGNVSETSLSYGFLYIYELLSNIGVNDPQDGLDQLMSFWKAFRLYNKTIDKYILRWLKDYHIYYDLPQSFKTFIKKNELVTYYPKMADDDDNFDLFCAISKYNIRKSSFFTDDKVKLITDCFYFVTNKLRQVFIYNGCTFDESIFQPTKGMTAWTPFKDALFYHWMKQPDRRIVLSENEIYSCTENKWFFNKVITTEGGRELIGYVIKQIEAVLRQMTQYKYKLSANINTVSHPVVNQLNALGVSLENIVTSAVIAFYRQATKTVVKVDDQALSIIRREAFATQEKLIVPELEERIAPVLAPDPEERIAPVLTPDPEERIAPVPTPDPEERIAPVATPDSEEQVAPLLTAESEDRIAPVLTPDPEDRVASLLTPHNLSLAMPQVMTTVQTLENEPGSMSDIWENLKNILTETERQALSVLWVGKTDIKKFADACDMMLEVLVDGINEKAMDTIGDNLMDEAFVLYDDYKDKIKELME